MRQVVFLGDGSIQTAEPDRPRTVDGLGGDQGGGGAALHGVQGSLRGGDRVAMMVSQYLARPSFLLMPVPNDVSLEMASPVGCGRQRAGETAKALIDVWN